MTVTEKEVQDITASDITAKYGENPSVGAKSNGDGQLSYEVTEGTDVIQVNEEGTITVTKVGSATVKIFASETAEFAAAEKEISVTVGKASLVIKAKDKSAYVGDEVPTLEGTDYEVTGLVGADKLTAEPVLAYETEPDMTQAGIVAIKVSGANAGENYDITYEDGKLNITKKSSGGGGGGITPAANEIEVPAATDEGSVKVSAKNAKAGDKVTVTADPKEGYEPDGIVVKDEKGEEVKVTDNGDGTYTFAMPDSKVTIEPKFKKSEDEHSKVCPSKKCTDVDTSQWYHEDIDFVLDKGMMNGTGETTFAPNGTVTRAMIVTILYRLEGTPTAEASSFTDVEKGSWYEAAVNWAASEGVVKGTSETTFAPNDPITREQFATILYRYAGKKGIDVSKVADLSGYTDLSSISNYALDAMSWANAEGLITGMSETTLVPTGNATRAQAAAILHRGFELVTK